MPRSGRAGPATARILAAAAVAAIVAELAVVLLSPHVQGPAPASADERAYFSSGQLDRARDYQGGQRLLGLGGVLVGLGVLAILATGHPRWLRRRLERLDAHPLLGAVAAGAGLSVALALAALPVDAVAHSRSVDFGISTQGAGGWLADRARSAAIGAVLAAAGASALIALQRRAPRHWWIGASGVVVGFAAFSSWIAPVVLAPLFNRFEPLPPGPARSDVLDLARRAGVDVGQVYSVDASRRVTSLNAYVDGLGSTKRVVLYDNLLNGVEQPALRAVVAHELGHVANHDIPRGILFVALIAPAGMLTAKLWGDRLAGAEGAAPGSPSALPAYALALSVAAFGLGIAGNQLSRSVESAADSFALDLTGDPQATIALQRRLAVANLADPSPPGWAMALFASHPSTDQRIGRALAYEQLHPPATDGQRQGAKDQHDVAPQ